MRRSEGQEEYHKYQVAKLHEALQQGRKREKNEEFKEEYKSGKG